MRLRAEGNSNEQQAPPKKEAVLDATASKEKLDKAYNLNIVNEATSIAQNSVNGILYGGLTGLVASYFLKQNIYWGGAFGALVGGILGYATHQANCD